MATVRRYILGFEAGLTALDYQFRDANNAPLTGFVTIPIVALPGDLYAADFDTLPTGAQFLVWSEVGAGVADGTPDDLGAVAAAVAPVAAPVPTLALDPNTGQLTVTNGVAGVTYTVYQVADNGSVTPVGVMDADNPTFTVPGYTPPAPAASVASLTTF